MTMRQKMADESQDAYLIACIRFERDQEWRAWVRRVETAFAGSVLDRGSLLFLEGYPPPDCT